MHYLVIGQSTHISLVSAFRVCSLKLRKGAFQGPDSETRYGAHGVPAGPSDGRYYQEGGRSFGHDEIDTS